MNAQSKLAPGTLCVLIGVGEPNEYVNGRTCTVVRLDVGNLMAALFERDIYIVTAPWIVSGKLEKADRACLQPILPPGVDTTITERADKPEQVPA